MSDINEKLKKAIKQQKVRIQELDDMIDWQDVEDLMLGWAKMGMKVGLALVAEEVEKKLGEQG